MDYVPQTLISSNGIHVKPRCSQTGHTYKLCRQVKVQKSFVTEWLTFSWIAPLRWALRGKFLVCLCVSLLCMMTMVSGIWRFNTQSCWKQTLLISKLLALPKHRTLNWLLVQKLMTLPKCTVKYLKSKLALYFLKPWFSILRLKRSYLK